MVCFRVIGSDMTVTMAAEGGQLQLNVFEPVIAACIFEAQTMFMNAVRTLRLHCVDGITANADVVQHYVEYSIGMVTALNPVIGYDALHGARGRGDEDRPGNHGAGSREKDPHRSTDCPGTRSSRDDRRRPPLRGPYVITSLVATHRCVSCRRPDRVGRACAPAGAVAAHRRRAGDGRDHRRSGQQQRAGRVHVRPGRCRSTDRRRAGNQEDREPARRADLEHRLAGHERRGLVEAGQPRQRARRHARRRRRRDHARHRHDRGDRVFPEPRREVEQARRPDRLDAAGDGALGRRPAELLQRRGGGGEQGRRGSRRDGRCQRLDSRRGVADQDQHDRRADLHVAAVRLDRHGRVRRHRVQSRPDRPAHQ